MPKRLLIIGGGIIGLEMATVYDALGSKVSVVEFMDRLIPGADPDIVKPLARRIEKRYEKIMLKTKVTKIESHLGGPQGALRGAEGEPPEPEIYDRVLLAVGRRPNGKNIGADKAGVNVNERGWIPVDRQMRTNVPHIFAIGDIVRRADARAQGDARRQARRGGDRGHEPPRLGSAHHPERRLHRPRGRLDGALGARGEGAGRRVRQGGVSVGGQRARARHGRARKASPRCSTRRARKRILGAGIVGVNAGELIAETVLALEMGADAEDIGLTIHPHPTLSETVFFTAEIAEGSITDMMPPKRPVSAAQDGDSAARLAGVGRGVARRVRHGARSRAARDRRGHVPPPRRRGARRRASPPTA